MAKTPKKPRALNPKQELFCQYYSNELFGNATLSYSAAYGIELLNLSRKIVDGARSPYQRKYDLCMVNGSKLLRNTKVAERLRILMKTRINDDTVDTERGYVIMQREDLGAKIRGIASYDKLMGRIKEKLDITSDGEPISGIEIVMPGGK